MLLSHVGWLGQPKRVGKNTSRFVERTCHLKTAFVGAAVGRSPKVATDGCADEGRFQSPAFVGESQVSDPSAENFTQKLRPIHCQLFMGSSKPRLISLKAVTSHRTPKGSFGVLGLGPALGEKIRLKSRSLAPHGLCRPKDPKNTRR